MTRPHPTAREELEMRYSEYPRAERVLLHLSDTHLRAAGTPLYVDASSEC